MSVRRWRQESTPSSARNSRALRELRERTPHIPIIIDAGIGPPSQACQVMEWGFDGVLLNIAISRVTDPVWMALPSPAPPELAAALSLPVHGFCKTWLFQHP